MRVVLYGGFAEKGRTCIGIEAGGYRLLVDAGVKTSSRAQCDYYPAIDATSLRAQDAIVVTHAHEDHVAALGWCLALGFCGRIYMTPETWREAGTCLADYAEPAHHALARAATVDCLPIGENVLRLGPLDVSAGRSGHVAGGVWCRFDDGVTRLVYCGDVAPRSPVFAMDPIPACDAVVIDASYGDDTTDANTRAAQIASWIMARPQGCVMPTPLYGRSVELLAFVPGAVALAPGMRDALRAQIECTGWLADAMADPLRGRLAAAVDWHAGDPLPRAALLCHDGMGISGTSPDILERAPAAGHPMLFTGHLPAHSRGEQLVAEGRADWIRLPTHPTLPDNVALVARSRASLVIGHSCDRSALARLARDVPFLRTDLATGNSLDL
jgi:glyoxylase-like metal-dependent hydrolase (beta-lactamase superfamily II)